MAAPSFGSSGTYAEGEGSTVSLAVPSGVAANDVIIAVFFINGQVTITSLAAGFAHVEGSPVSIAQGLGGDHSLAVVWKRATGADTGTYDFTLSASAFRAGQAHRYTDCVASGTPFDSPTASATDPTLGTVTPAVAVTTLGPDRSLLHAATNWASGTWTPPTDFTKRMQGGFGHATLADKIQASAGSSGSITATCTGNDKRTAWLGALIGTTTSEAPPGNATSTPTVTAARTSTPTATGKTFTATVTARATSTPTVSDG